MSDERTPYLSLARKYRPQTLEALIGQPHLTATLARAITQKRIAQAYLFAGMRGVGKTSAARILAKCLNCEHGPTAKPCNACPSCTQITQGNSLDVIEIDGASNRGIDEIRNLRQTVAYAPTIGSFRLYIIDEVHMLTTEAFNALLKTLEEPPAHVKFIFATTAPHKVPATVLSRCQRFDFRRLEAATIVEALGRIAKAERLTIDEPALYAIARASDGSLRDAEVVLEQVSSFVAGRVQEPDVTALLGVVEPNALLSWTQAILERRCPDALILLTAQLDLGKDATQLLLGLLQHVRNLLILRSTVDAASREALIERLIDEPAERLAQLEQQAATCSVQEWLLILQLLTGTYELMRRSPMAQTVLELVVIKLCTREQWQSLSEISRRLEQLSVSTDQRLTNPLPRARESVSTLLPEAPSPAPSLEAPSAASGSAAETEAVNTSMGVPAELAGMWPVFLERLGSQKMSLAAYLMEAKPLHLEQQTLVVGLPGFSLHHEVLSVAENRRLIERLLTEAYQRPITVQYTTLSESDAPPPGQGEPVAGAAAERPEIVQDIVKLFNATILDQPRPTS